MDRKLAVFHAVTLLSTCLAVAGCTNKPGSLQLELTTENQEIRPTDPIRIHATLSAPKAPVCLAEYYSFQVEMSRKDGHEVVTSRGLWVCGTGFVSSVFLYPVFYSMSILDVGNMMGRFDVIKKGSERTHSLEVIPGESILHVMMDSTERPTGKLDPSWTPGQYVVRIRLQGTEPVFYPAPLFWKPYNQPVEAEIEIEVREDH